LFVGAEPFSLILPIINLLAITLYVVWWIAIAGLIYSCGDPITKGPATFPFANFQIDAMTKPILIFHFASFFWIVAFISTFNEFVICSAVCIWYFQQDHPPIIKSIYRGLRYYLGAIAMGSFLLALVWLL